MITIKKKTKMAKNQNQFYRISVGRNQTKEQVRLYTYDDIKKLREEGNNELYEMYYGDIPTMQYYDIDEKVDANPDKKWVREQLDALIIKVVKSLNDFNKHSDDYIYMINTNLGVWRGKTKFSFHIRDINGPLITPQNQKLNIRKLNTMLNENLFDENIYNSYGGLRLPLSAKPDGRIDQRIYTYSISKGLVESDMNEKNLLITKSYTKENHKKRQLEEKEQKEQKKQKKKVDFKQTKESHLEQVLECIPSTEYDIYLKVAMYLKSVENGLPVFLKWAKNNTTEDNYDEEKAISLFNGLQKDSKITMGSMIHYAKKYNPEKFKAIEPAKYTDEYELMKQKFEKNYTYLLNPTCIIDLKDTRKMKITDAKYNFANWRYSAGDKSGGEKDSDFLEAWLKDPDRRQYDYLEWVPYQDKDPTPHNALNTFKKPNRKIVTEEEVNNNDFVDMYKKVVTELCGGEEDEDACKYGMSYIADSIQNPHRSPETAWILKGDQGVGKDKVTDVINLIWGGTSVFKTSNMNDIFGNFNEQIDKTEIF